ncbi:MAG: hypothetical protein WC749_10390 [Dehalococcoidia bacterium]
MNASLAFRERLQEFDKEASDGLSDLERAARYAELAAALIIRESVGRREPPLVGDDSIER